MYRLHWVTKTTWPQKRAHLGLILIIFTCSIKICLYFFPKYKEVHNCTVSIQLTLHEPAQMLVPSIYYVYSFKNLSVFSVTTFQISVCVITTTKLICNFHGTRAGAGRRGGGQTPRGDSDLLFCRAELWKRERRVVSFSLKLYSVTNRLSFSEQNVCTSAKSRREREERGGGGGGGEGWGMYRQQGGRAGHVDRIDEDQMNFSRLIMLNSSYAQHVRCWRNLMMVSLFPLKEMANRDEEEKCDNSDKSPITLWWWIIVLRAYSLSNNTSFYKIPVLLLYKHRSFNFYDNQV